MKDLAGLATATAPPMLLWTLKIFSAEELVTRLIKNLL
jgi:hypothetical protein